MNIILTLMLSLMFITMMCSPLAFGLSTDTVPTPTKPTSNPDNTLTGNPNNTGGNNPGSGNFGGSGGINGPTGGTPGNTPGTKLFGTFPKSGD